MRRAVFSGKCCFLIECHDKAKSQGKLTFQCHFSILVDSQRKGLEKRFQIQKYISKPDRKKLAERLGLKDSQVSLTSELFRDELSHINLHFHSSDCD